MKSKRKGSGEQKYTGKVTPIGDAKRKQTPSRARVGDALSLEELHVMGCAAVGIPPDPMAHLTAEERAKIDAAFPRDAAEGEG